MIFECLVIISHILLSPHIVRTVQEYLNNLSTERFHYCAECEISDPWESLTEEEYIADILENSREDTNSSDYNPKLFDIYRNKADDYIGHYYQAGG
jgi:hypothetical protein